MRKPEISPNQAGSIGPQGLGESWLDSSDQQRVLVEQLSSGRVVTQSFDFILQNQGLIREEAGRLLGQYSFESDTPASELAQRLTGGVFQELAYLYLRGLFDEKKWLLVHPFRTGAIFKKWRQFLVDQEGFRVTPDGIFVENQNNRAVVVRGFTEYAMSPEINLDAKYNQLLNLQKVIEFLFTDGRWSFLQTMREHRPKSWPKKLVLGEPETFGIFYVIPKNKYLPESLRLAGVVEIRAPLAWGEVVDLAKAMAGDYFGVEIR